MHVSGNAYVFENNSCTCHHAVVAAFFINSKCGQIAVKRQASCTPASHSKAVLTMNLMGSSLVISQAIVYLIRCCKLVVI